MRRVARIQRPGGFGGGKQLVDAADVDGPVIVDGSPVADFRRTMHDVRRAGDGFLQRLRVAHVAVHLLDSPVVEQLRIAVGTDEHADGNAVLPRALDDVAADETGRAGDEQQVGGVHCIRSG
jgi:hypothetical protein